jgi:hypothetical protein
MPSDDGLGVVLKHSTAPWLHEDVMMKRTALCLLLAAAVATPALARVEDPHAATPAADASTSKIDRIVCKPRQATGSRLPSSKVCKTQREWDAMSEEIRQNRDMAEKHELNPNGIGPMEGPMPK